MPLSRFASALAVVALAGAAPAKVPPLPAHWPHTLQIGMSQEPGEHFAPLGFRYAYLAGGVNTGDGWATWNANGAYASLYAQDSWRRGQIPVFSYYMLLQSKPGGGDEQRADLGNLRNAATMDAYWKDVRLLFTRIKGTKPVVVHVEPDLWGYLEQANATALASSYAKKWIQLRNELAPNALLAYHMSGWGTKHDIVYEDPPDATVRAYAAQSAAFYKALKAKFDVAFEDFADRDAGFYAKINGDPKTWFTPADFHRHLLYGQTFVQKTGVRMVAWQIPLGNTVSPVMNDTWNHFRDNRVQWLLASRAHLRAYVAAGYVGFLFGRGADGATCACDADKDGVDDDGGYFKSQVRAYYKTGVLKLP